MSTKMYTAYKLKDPSKLWEFCRDVKKKAIKNIRSKLVELEKDFIDNGIDFNSEEYKKRIEKLVSINNMSAADADIKARREIVEKFMFNEYKAASLSNKRDYFDFDVYLSFREYKNDIFIIPYCDMAMSKVLDFLENDEYLEDFHYQNSTDKPNHISEKEWDNRRNIWFTISDAGWYNYLKLEILCLDNYHNHSPAAQRFKLNWNFQNLLR